MRLPVAAGLCLARLALGVAVAHGAAVLVPDHLHRLGRCGPAGPACTWRCADAGVCEAAGPTCAAPGTTCALHATAAFRGVVRVSIDDSSCVSSGAVMTIGLAGTLPNGMTFQILDKVIDLCDRSMECTGRDQRDCSECPGVCTDQCTDDSDCDCPPGPVVFLCKDPFFDSVNTALSEQDLPFVVNWLAGGGGSQTRQPLLQLIRNDLAEFFPDEPGRPVLVDASTQSLDTSADVPSGRFCVKVWYLLEGFPLGHCEDDPAQNCAENADCSTGSCVPWVPDLIDPPEFTTVASGRRCSGNGRPCVGAEHCPGGETCDPTTASVDTGGACSDTNAPCTSSAECSQFENCVFCATTPCGDVQVDPGEECDDGNTTSGDGCSATCQAESGCPPALDPACTGGFGKAVRRCRSSRAMGRHRDASAWSCRW